MVILAIQAIYFISNQLLVTLENKISDDLNFNSGNVTGSGVYPLSINSFSFLSEHRFLRVCTPPTNKTKD